MHTNQTYEFLVEAKIDYNAIADQVRWELEGFIGDLKVGELISRSLLFRIVLCDVSKIGFCNPIALSFIDHSDQERNDTIYLLQNGWFSNVSTDEVLQAAQIGNHIFSPWLDLKLNEVANNTFAARTKVKLQLPDGKRGSHFVIGHGHITGHFQADNRTDELLELFNLIYDGIQSLKPPAPAPFNESEGDETDDDWMTAAGMNTTGGVFVFVRVLCCLLLCMQVASQAVIPTSLPDIRSKRPTPSQIMLWM